MSKPIRIQRKRTKGFNLQKLSMELNGLAAVSVCRPGKWGNPFKISDAIDVGYFKKGDPKATEFVVDAFRYWLTHGERRYWQGKKSNEVCNRMISELDELRGKNLACFCPLDQPCHADVLLEIANE